MTVNDVRRLVLYEGGANMRPNQETRARRRAFWRLLCAWRGWSADATGPLELPC